MIYDMIWESNVKKGEAKIQTRNIGLRTFSMDFLCKHGMEITGTVLNCGSSYDRFDYSRFFPNCRRYRLLDLKDPRSWHGREYREVLLADVQNMPQIPTDSEDCIIAYWLLYLLPDVESALAEFNRVLKPDGVLLASLIADTARGKPKDPTNPNFYDEDGNIRRRWSYHEASELIGKFFEVEEIEPYCETPDGMEADRFILDGMRLLMTFIKARNPGVMRAY